MLGKITSCVFVTLLCGIPTELYLIVRWLLNPEGLLAELLVLGLGLYVLGALQLVLLVVWLFLLLFILTGPRPSRIKRS